MACVSCTRQGLQAHVRDGLAAVPATIEYITQLQKQACDVITRSEAIVSTKAPGFGPIGRCQLRGLCVISDMPRHLPRSSPMGHGTETYGPDFWIRLGLEDG